MSESDGGKDRSGLSVDQVFGRFVGRLGSRLLASLDGLERTFRQLHPPALPVLRERLVPLREALDEALSDFDGVETPASLEAFRKDLVSAGELARDALAGLIDPGRPEEGALRAMHQHARAQAILYPLRRVLPPVSAFFAESFVRARVDSLEASGEPSDAAQIGLFRSGDPEARGGFDFYVPESYDPDGDEPWPLVIALHGGSGNGADFLWTWLREARSRRCLLLAPTSRGSTWSLHAPEIDGAALVQMTEWVASRWRVDRERVLLTGLSDGATMTLLVGPAVDAPYTHLAPISGVLHPMNFANGNLDRMRGRPIYLVHGALDWMFPIALAREAAEVLEDAGAELVFREIDDLSHTYPREENARIIEWLAPSRVVAST